MITAGFCSGLNKLIPDNLEEIIRTRRIGKLASEDNDDFDRRKQQEIRRHYDGDYFRPLLDSYLNKDRFSRYRLEMVFEIYSPEKGERILDLGCGVGTFALELARRGIDVVGLDYSQESIDICQRLADELNLKASFRLGEATDTGLESDSYDLIIAADLTEHLYPEVFRDFLAEAERLLKKGGRLLIWTPNPGHIFEFLKQRNIVLKRDEGHVGYKTLEQLKEELTDQGFTIEKAYHRHSHLPVWGFVEQYLQWAVPFMRRRNAVLAVK